MLSPPPQNLNLLYNRGGGGSHVNILSFPLPQPQDADVWSLVWYHLISLFETNKFHYPPFFFIRWVVVEVFKCLEIISVTLYRNVIFPKSSEIKFKWSRSIVMSKSKWLRIQANVSAHLEMSYQRCLYSEREKEVNEIESVQWRQRYQPMMWRCNMTSISDTPLRVLIAWIPTALRLSQWTG